MIKLVFSNSNYLIQNLNLNWFLIFQSLRIELCQLLCCETNTSPTNSLDVKRRVSLFVQGKNIHNTWYLLKKLNAYQFMKKIIIFCHASLKEEQFRYFAYFATLRNTCCYLTLEEGCVFIILRTPLRICAWVDEMTSGAYQKHFFQWNFANTIGKITN